MAPSIKKYSVLVVDDDSVTRNVHKKYLTKNGFDLKMAEDGYEAVHLIRAGYCFDLVIMDMEMPIMNGIQATMEIRAMGVKSLIIGMSNITNNLKIQEFMNAGLDDYFSTPMNMAKLAAIVRRLECP